MPQKTYIIGVGDDGAAGLTASANQLIEQAEVLIGSRQTLAAARQTQAERVEVETDFDVLIQAIAANPERRMVILATGDPLFYGTARFLCDRFGKDRFEVVPHVSSMQLAFARVKESWDEAYLTNLATQKLDRVIERIRSAEKVGLFTTETFPPALIARTLLDRRIDYFQAYVCENLGSPDERVTQGDLVDLLELEFSPLNVMVLIRKPNVPDRPVAMIGRRLFGNPDEMFLQSQPKRGLLTPAEVRVLALAQLDIGPASVIWDVGAGSGSVGIEAAQMAAQGHVYAIEMDPEDHLLIATNAERFGVPNLTPVLGRAPEVWADLPDPDAVFVGGTGRMVVELAEAAFFRLRSRGRMVVNSASIQNVTDVHTRLQQLAGDAHVWMIQIARDVPQLDRLSFQSANPSFLIAAVKGER